MTYPNLKAEIARSGLTYNDILARGKEDGRLNCTISTLSLKINGKAEFTLSESVALKEIIGTDLPLNELFKSEPEA